MIPKTSQGNAIYFHNALVYAVGFSPYALIQPTCANMIRNLTCEAWNTSLSGQPYGAIYPDLPIEPEITSTTYP